MYLSTSIIQKSVVTVVVLKNGEKGETTNLYECNNFKCKYLFEFIPTFPLYLSLIIQSTSGIRWQRDCVRSRNCRSTLEKGANEKQNFSRPLYILTRSGAPPSASRYRVIGQNEKITIPVCGVREISRGSHSYEERDASIFSLFWIWCRSENYFRVAMFAHLSIFCEDRRKHANVGSSPTGSDIFSRVFVYLQIYTKFDVVFVSRQHIQHAS